MKKYAKAARIGVLVVLIMVTIMSTVSAASTFPWTFPVTFGEGDEGEVEITLATGWNIFGYTNSTATDALGIANKVGSNCTYVTERNKTSGDYVNFDPDVPEVSNFAVERGWGYFVDVSDNTNLTMTSSTGTYEITLVDGWYIFGWTNASTWDASLVATDIGTNCTYVTECNKTSGDFSSYNPDIPELYNFDVEHGWGYFVKVSDETVWNRTA